MSSMVHVTQYFLIFNVVSSILLIVNASSEEKNGGDVRNKVVFALNAGGTVPVIDSNGIEFMPDPYANKDVGISSDYGARFLTIGRTLNSNEAYLYQTERYGLSNFGYNLPMKTDGDYVLVLKFCEVYFINPGRKIFDVRLNNHLIVKNLDIFKKVGHAVAYDEIIPFKVAENGKVLVVGGEKSNIMNGQIKLDFIKGPKDNPKINAFYIMRGSIEDVPKLPPMSDEPYDQFLDEEESDDSNLFDGHENNLTDEDEENEEENELQYSTPSRRSAKSSPSFYGYDPYEDDDWGTVVPICAAITISVVTLIMVWKILGKPGV